MFDGEINVERFYLFDLLGETNDEKLCLLDNQIEDLGLGDVYMRRGERLGDRFPADARLYMDDEHPGKKLSDLLGNSNNLLLGSKKLVELVKKHCGDMVECLPFTLYDHRRRVASKDYSLIHPLTIADCLDLGKSDIEWNSVDPESISRIRRHVVDRKRLAACRQCFDSSSDQQTFSLATTSRSTSRPRTSRTSIGKSCRSGTSRTRSIGQEISAHPSAPHPVPSAAVSTAREDEWLWGWDPTPGIVSVWAEPDGRAFVWRRLPESGELVREDVRFRPWLLLASLDELAHLGTRLRPETQGPAPGCVTFEELDGPGALRFLVRAQDGRMLTSAVLQGASRRRGRAISNLRDLEEDAVIALPPEEQYLVATGRTYFRDLGFDSLRRLQFDLETTGLDPASIGSSSSRCAARKASPRRSRRRATATRRRRPDRSGSSLRIRALDPDVIENHNLHGFDLPFLAHRARQLRVPLSLGRAGGAGPARAPRLAGVEARRRAAKAACATRCPDAS